MVLYLSYDPHLTIQHFMIEMLNNFDIPYERVGAFEIHLKKNVTEEQKKTFLRILKAYKISLIEDPKEELVRKIKQTIHILVRKRNVEDGLKLSCYLSNKLGFSYAHLSKVFSELTFSSIENYLIMERIEYVKYLIIHEKLTLTEIAYKLNYSSVAHLSLQFKKTTGLTFSGFQKIINKKNSKKQTYPKLNELSPTQYYPD